MAADPNLPKILALTLWQPTDGMQSLTRVLADAETRLDSLERSLRPKLEFRT